MKTFLRTLATILDRAIGMIGCITIMSFMQALWPVVYRVCLGVLLPAFGVWYVWKCIIQPFRAGLRGES
jgi:hypothetical protein